MPEGTVIAKDSFTVTDDGDVYPGPLFLMEKMAPGFSPQTGDWRYTMIMPDGSVFGVTGGQNATSVAFCANCHGIAGDSQDHLIFIPTPYRTPVQPTESTDGG